MSATSELAALRAFAAAALPLVEHYKAKRCSYISDHHVSQVDAAIDAMDLWKSIPAPVKTLKFDVLDLIREPDNYTSSERAFASGLISDAIQALLGIEGRVEEASKWMHDSTLWEEEEGPGDLGITVYGWIFREVREVIDRMNGAA